jgi:AcrR family transcriptional regulator
MRNSIHPTKSLLVETAVKILDTKKPHEVSVDEILETSGISKGSLYHHFTDLSELMEVAQVARYADWVDRSIALIVEIVSKAKSKEDIYQGVQKMTTLTQSSNFKNFRFERARTIGNSEGNERFQKALAVEQERLTSGLADVIREVIEKGFFSKDLDPAVVAVFIQAYTLGKIVDDVVAEPVSSKNWDKFVDHVVLTSIISQ